MTTNHPANGPVSLDRLHQIREILSKAAAQSDGGNLGYAMADAVKVIEVAIAAFGAEPVLYAAEETLAYAKMGELHLKCLSQPMGDAVIPLYTAPPAPVVPEWTNEECLEFLSIAFRHAEIKGDLELDDIRLGVKMVNGGRAAMLQAGNSPVTPDGWIPVSERMPDDDDFVYIWPRPEFGIELHVGQYCECHPKGDGWYAQVYEQNYGIEWHPIIVTHWMPLPAAPHFREIGNSSTNNFREKSETSTNPVNLNFNGATDCWCRTCRPVTVTDMRFVVCPDCGNKRCPRANDHRNDCSGSNEPGQAGSTYPAAPQQEE